MLRKSFFGMMALIIGVMFIFTACDTGNGDNGDQQQQGTPQAVTYVSEDTDGNLYTLEIIESLPNRSARYTAKQGDSFKLTVELYNGVDYSIGLVYEGTVGSTTANGEKIVINITVNNKQLKITIVGNEMTVIEGEIVDINGQAVVDTPEELSTFIDKRALEAAFAAANMAKQDVVVNVNGTDVAKNVYWVTQAQMDTFTAAIATAQAFYGETDAHMVPGTFLWKTKNSARHHKRTLIRVNQ